MIYNKKSIIETAKKISLTSKNYIKNDTSKKKKKNSQKKPQEKFEVQTFASPGLVANLSRFSPLSSNKITTLSEDTTAILVLFGAHAIEVILAAPS